MPIVEAGTKFVPAWVWGVPCGSQLAARTPALLASPLPFPSAAVQRDTLTELYFASYFLGDVTLDFQRWFCFPVSMDRMFSQIHMLRLNAQGDGVRRWGTWGVVMRVEPCQCC